jgi:hypothetical protein
MKLIFFIISLSINFIITGSLHGEELVKPTRSLNGSDITYEYTSGRSYHVKFEEIGVSYRYLTGSKPGIWWGPFPYKGFEVSSNVFYISWFEKGYGDYVTLLINFNNNLLYGSAILAGKDIHFHGAKIIKLNRK